MAKKRQRGAVRREAPAQSVVRSWPEGSFQGVGGFRSAALHCGLKSDRSKPDLALLCCDGPVSAAGVFTTNLVCAAPVLWSRRALARTGGRACGVIVNAGNANACTGRQGEQDAQRMAQWAARALGCSAERVLVCSTGIIGRPLPMAKLERGIGRLGKLIRRPAPSGDFTRAILTTDLVAKTSAKCVEIGGTTVRMYGCTKGSGMIGPHMATTLGFVATDLAVVPEVLQRALGEVAEETFNCITVDGDTSTNDTLLVLASGRAGNRSLGKASGAEYAAFRALLYAVCDDLARQIAADGEGAGHTVTIYVGGARSAVEARQIARTIANSPLVKTAIAGCDPNWGRIMAAAGRAGVAFSPEASSLTVCGHELFRNGVPLPFEAAAVSRAMRNREVSVVLMVGDGPESGRCYTCDFTHGYIEINADYHT